ncbi:MAG: hypothetical protein ACOYOK_16060 [Pseudobdellovibrionaceae bacterium]
MKKMLLMTMLVLLGEVSQAGFAIGVGYSGAQTNCNLQMGGRGVVSNCSFNANGTVVCSCDEIYNPYQGRTCNTAIGVGYSGVQTNCTLQSGGKGSISNCSFNTNGTVLCSCCY